MLLPLIREGNKHYGNNQIVAITRCRALHELRAPLLSARYCQQSGLTDPEALCQQGYYCPEGSNVPNPVVCPIGLQCPLGSDQPLSCAPGMFTNRTGMWACDICPDG